MSVNRMNQHGFAWTALLLFAVAAGSVHAQVIEIRSADLAISLDSSTQDEPEEVFCVNADESLTFRLKDRSPRDAEPVESTAAAYHVAVIRADSSTEVASGPLMPADPLSLPPLAKGVYEIQLSQVTAPSSRWMEWLPGTSRSVSESVSPPRTWPLVVLPSLTAKTDKPPSVADASSLDPKQTRLMVRLKDADLQGNSAASSSAAKDRMPSKEDRVWLSRSWRWKSASTATATTVIQSQFRELQKAFDVAKQVGATDLILNFGGHPGVDALTRWSMRNANEASLKIWLEVSCDCVTRPDTTFRTRFADESCWAGWFFNLEDPRQKCSRCAQRQSIDKEAIVEFAKSHPERSYLVAGTTENLAGVTDPIHTIQSVRRKSIQTLAGQFSVVTPPSPTSARTIVDGIWMGRLDSVASEADKNESRAMTETLQWKQDFLQVQFADSTPNWLVVDLPQLQNADVMQTLLQWRHANRTGMAWLQPADPSDRSVRVKTVTVDGVRSFWIINRMTWPVEVTLSADAATHWLDKPAAIAQEDACLPMRLTIPRMMGLGSGIEIPAGGAVVCQTDSELPPSMAFASNAIGGAEFVSDTTRRVTRLVENLGMIHQLTRPPNSKGFIAPDEWSETKYPVNGDFEQTGNLGIVGWMHAQHPADSVRLEEGVSHTGSRSIRLSGRAAPGSQAWIISETLPTPASGRLRATIAVRAASSPTAVHADATAKIRVALEGTRGNAPRRESVTADIPQDGAWHTDRVTLELLDLLSSEDTNLRLTIDNLSDSTIWIDNIEIKDWFASEAERSEIQSLAYLAVQGLQRGDLTPTSTLLKNFWASELLRVAAQNPSHDLPPKTPSSSYPQPAWRQPVTVQPEPDGGMTQRVKQWLPQPLRF